MPVNGTIRLYRPDPASISAPETRGRATMSVQRQNATRIQISVCGDVDAVNGRFLGRYVERHTGTAQQMILDLRAVDFFGSQGFTALYYISVHCTRSSVDWIVIGGPPVRRLLQICDPDRELPFVDDLDAACQRLDRMTQARRRAPSAG